MNKIDKINATKISLIGKQVVLKEKQFDTITETINSLIETVNFLIDENTRTNLKTSNNTKKINETLSTVQKLAKALKTLTEE